MDQSHILDYFHADDKACLLADVRTTLYLLLHHEETSPPFKIDALWIFSKTCSNSPWKFTCLSLQILRVALINGIAAIMETPFSALTKHLPPYQALLRSPGVTMCRSDSCMFGSIHHKPFRFLGVHVDLRNLQVKCSRDHKHVFIEGALTKGSATYAPGLADALALCFAKSIRAFKQRVDELSNPQSKGLESQVINSVATSSTWKVDRAWTFKRPAHINILEFSVLEKLALDLVRQGQFP